MIGHSASGPRGAGEATAAERASPANIILLCPTCHTKIDRAEEEYPAGELFRMKEHRRRAVSQVSGTTHFQSREQARAAVEGILDRLHTVFVTIGPDPETGGLASVEESERWSREVLETIVPGHQMIVAIVNNNPDLATGSDRQGAEQLRIHAQGLLEKHSGLPLTAPVIRFPLQAEQIFSMGATP